MNNEMIKLARRFVRASGWEWVRGMPAVADLRDEKVGLICTGSYGPHIADFYCLDYQEPWDDIHVDEQRKLDLVPDLDCRSAVYLIKGMALDAYGMQDSVAFPLEYLAMALEPIYE